MIGRKKKLAVVFGSGGARGWAHIGVLQALRELGLKPEFAAGTSVGSIVAAIAATGTLDKFEKLAEKMDWKEAAKLFVEFGMHRSGIIEGRRVMSLLGSLIPNSEIVELDIPFAASAMDIKTQKEIVFRTGKVLDAIRASISIPGLFTPEHYNKDLWLVDGGLVNPLPISIVRAAGDYKIAAVDVNLNMSGVAKPAAALQENSPGARSNKKQAGFFETAFSADRPPLQADDFRRKLSEFAGEVLSFAAKGINKSRAAEPTLLDVMVQSVRAAENAITRERLLREPPDVLIQPAVGHIGTLDFHRSDEAVKAGYTATMAIADRL